MRHRAQAQRAYRPGLDRHEGRRPVSSLMPGLPVATEWPANAAEFEPVPDGWGTSASAPAQSALIGAAGMVEPLDVGPSGDAREIIAPSYPESSQVSGAAEDRAEASPSDDGPIDLEMADPGSEDAPDADQPADAPTPDTSSTASSDQPTAADTETTSTTDESAGGSTSDPSWDGASGPVAVVFALPSGDPGDPTSASGSGTWTSTSTRESFAAFEGQVTRVTLGSLSYAAGTLGEYSATVDWGDGTSSPATFSDPQGGGTAILEATHTYAEEGEYAVRVDVRRDGSPDTGQAAWTMTVYDAPLTAQAVTLLGTGGPSLSGVVARFTDANPNGTVSDYSAWIDWGGGQFTGAKIQADGAGGFEVIGDSSRNLDASPPTSVADPYRFEGEYPFTVTIADQGGYSVSVDGVADVLERPLQFGPLSALMTSGVDSLAAVASFDANPADPVGNFSATIDWGDGTTTDGIIGAAADDPAAGSVLPFVVYGRHAYAASGYYSTHITVRNAYGATIAAPGVVLARDATDEEPGPVLDSRPTVTIEATGPDAYRADGTPGQYTVTRTGDTSADLTVSYTVSGTATPGTDYEPLTGIVTIPAGSDSATITVPPLGDDPDAPIGSVIVSLSDDPGSSYSVGELNKAAVRLAGAAAPPSNAPPRPIITGHNVLPIINPPPAPADPNYQMDNVPVGSLLTFKLKDPDAQHHIQTIQWSGGTTYSSYLTRITGQESASASKEAKGPLARVSVQEAVKTTGTAYKFIVDPINHPYTVTVHVTYREGGEADLTVTFASMRPTFAFTALHGGAPALLQSPDVDRDNTLNINDIVRIRYEDPGEMNNKAGFSLTASTSSDFEASFMFLQMLDAQRFAEGKHPIATQGAFRRWWTPHNYEGPALDNSGDAMGALGYRSFPRQTGGDDNSWIFSKKVFDNLGKDVVRTMVDAPFASVPASFDKFSIGQKLANGDIRPESFNTYLMYKPLGGAWVALAKVRWEWGMGLENKNGQWQSVWAHNPGPVVTDTIVDPREWFPSWTDTALDMKVRGQKYALPPESTGTGFAWWQVRPKGISAIPKTLHLTISGQVEATYTLTDVSTPGEIGSNRRIFASGYAESIKNIWPDVRYFGNGKGIYVLSVFRSTEGYSGYFHVDPEHTYFMLDYSNQYYSGNPAAPDILSGYRWVFSDEDFPAPFSLERISIFHLPDYDGYAEVTG